MNRRKFLGVLGLGAAAGPAAINNAIAPALEGADYSMKGNLAGPIGVYNGCISPDAEGNWEQREFEYLQRVLLGKLKDDEIEEQRVDAIRMLDRVAWQSVNSLRSVSPQAKMHMYHKQNREISQRVARADAARRLPRLAKQLGKILNI